MAGDAERHSRDPEVDAPRREARGGDGGASPTKQAKRRAAPKQAGAAGSGEAAPWFSSAGLRRRAPDRRDQGSAHADDGAAGCGAAVARRRRRPVRGWASLVQVVAAVVAAAVLLTVSLPLVALNVGVVRRSASTAAGLSAGYLRDAAAQFIRTAASGGVPPTGPPAGESPAAACAARAGLPPSVVLPPLSSQARLLNGGAADALRALDLDCGTPEGEGACARIAALTNGYEDGTANSGLDLAVYVAAWEAYEAASGTEEAVAEGALGPGLDALALDCDADPAECEAAAAASNGYSGAEGVAGAGGDAAAEAQAYLDARDAEAAAAAAAAAAADDDAFDAGSMLRVGALDLDCSGEAGAAKCAAAREASNSYEGAESTMRRARAAEEAAPGSTSVDALGLDCWGPAGDGVVDAETARECALARACNDYEAQPMARHGHALSHGHGEEVPFEFGPDGLPVSGPMQGYFLWIADADAAAASRPGGVMPAEREAARATAPVGHGAAAARSSVRIGYGDPADVAAAAVAPAPAAAQQAVGPQARLYFKNDCNNPAARVAYKNPVNSPYFHASRLYYKSPANVPHGSPREAPAGLDAGSLASFVLSFWWEHINVLLTLLAGLLGAVSLVQLQKGRPSRNASAWPTAKGSAEPEVAPLLPEADRGDESPRKLAAFGKPGILADSQSPRKATGPAASEPRQGVGEAVDTDAVPSGAVDSPRRAGTPQLARSATPLAGRTANVVAAQRGPDAAQAAGDAN